MAKEKASYRDNLERIIAKFPNKEFLKVKDVMEFTGLSYPTVKKLFTFNKSNFISIATLAREMS